MCILSGCHLASAGILHSVTSNHMIYNFVLNWQLYYSFCCHCSWNSDMWNMIFLAECKIECDARTSMQLMQSDASQSNRFMTVITWISSWFGRRVSIMEASLCLQILCGTMLGFYSFSQHLLLLTPSIVRSCRRWNHTTILIMCRRHRSSVGTPCTDPANSKSISSWFTARGYHSAGILRQHDILGVWPIPALNSSLHPVRNVIIEK